MTVKYDIERLKGIIKNIFDLTGVSISVLDTERRVLARCLREGDYCFLVQNIEAERLRCHECDMKILKKCQASKSLEKHICHAGLYDAAMPIVKDGAVVGYVIMGRVRSVNSPPVMQSASGIDGKTAMHMARLYRELPFLSEERLNALYGLLSSVVFDAAIRILYDPLLIELTDHIDANIGKPLCIGGLCSEFHISKNRLYKTFHENLGKTVNEYITERRLALARVLLTESNAPAYQIAEKVGIDNYAYFCKLFKKNCGVTPTEYRRSTP